MQLAVIGLGKLGLCTAACFAAKGHQVYGFDNKASLRQALQRGECPIDETGLPALLQQAKGKLSFVDSVADAVAASEVTLIIVPTPSLADGRFSNDYVDAALTAIGASLAKKKDFHVVAVVSTVMPGSCDKYFRPLLEKLSGKVCGRDFGLVYNPEFIALGSVIRDFLNPDMVLIGASDATSAERMRRLYETTCERLPQFAVMSPVNAEITKLSLNCYVTMKISFANELAALCERVPGADVDAVTTALGADTRIGGKYLKGGMGFGGPCFPRDNIALRAFAREIGTQARLGEQVVAINHDVVTRVFNLIESNVKRGEKVALLGLSYKPGTAVIEESQAIELAQRLINAGYRVTVHDTKALANARQVLGERVAYSSEVTSATKEVGAVVLLSAAKEYVDQDWGRVANVVLPQAVLIDCWREFKTQRPGSMRYIGLGMGVRV